MHSTVKFYLLLLIYVLLIREHAAKRETIYTNDKEYEIINFKVPSIVWKQALRPTPVLRSPVTIVLPVNVPQDDDSEYDDETENQVADNVVVDATLVSNDPVEVAQDPIVNPVNEPAVSEAAVIQDEVVQPDVPGQVTRFPCSCLEGTCECCTGAILQRFNMKACGNMTFIPEDFVFDVKLNVNNNTVAHRRVSASDPPPICFNPRRAPFVRVCAEISNIRIRNRNAYACLDINADIGGFPVYSAPFRCFGLGSSGIQTGLKPIKPISNGPKPVNLFGSGGEEEGGFIEDAVFGGGDGIFGGDGDGGLFGGGSDGGPFDAIGDAVGDFLDGRKLN